VVSIPAKAVAISGSLNRSMGRSWGSADVCGQFAGGVLQDGGGIGLLPAHAAERRPGPAPGHAALQPALAVGVSATIPQHDRSPVLPQRPRGVSPARGQPRTACTPRRVLPWAACGASDCPPGSSPASSPGPRFCRDEDDQGDLVAGHPNGADGASLSSNASARVAMTVSGSLPSSCCHC
jgi:hypothetical protein